MAKKTEWLWFVACEGHVTAPVIAESWEQATVEAAKFWGVRWGCGGRRLRAAGEAAGGEERVL